MSKEARRQARTIIALSAISTWITPATARGEEPFLWLPFSVGQQVCPPCERTCGIPDAYRVCIYCRWTCLNEDGTTYHHHATDYGHTGTGKEIRAAAGGEVIFVDDGVPVNSHPRGRPYGNRVEIRHANRYVTIYAHFLPGIRVSEGDRITAGQLLGLSDNTGRSSGPHLHFEVRDRRGEKVNPYGDPADYTGGCGPNALWVTCPPTPAPPDADGDGFTVAQGDCDDRNRDVHPGAAESCNGRDDDCNGTPDDPWRVGLSIDLDRPCTVGIGACASTGTWVCAPNGATAVCGTEPLLPQSESCNWLDDDCDGLTDEDWRVGLTTDLDQPCAITWDACRGSTTGTWVCAPSGIAVVCNAAPSGTAAATEVCNGVDDDCDGFVDNVLDRTIVEYAPEPRLFFSYPSLAWDESREQFGMSWMEVRQPPPGFEQSWTLHFALLDRNGDLTGSARSLSSEAYALAFDQAIGWNGDAYGVVWQILGPSSFGEREIRFIRVDPSGVPFGELVSIGDPLAVFGNPSRQIGHEVRLTATIDGWVVGEGGPFIRDALNNLYGTILLHRFSGDGTVVDAPIVVSEERSTQIDVGTLGLASMGDRDLLVYARNTGDVIGDAWEGSSRVQQATLGVRGFGQFFSRPALACAAGESCWVAWIVNDYAIRLHAFNASVLTVTEVGELSSLPRTPQDFELSCTESGCTLAIIAVASDGIGYVVSIATTEIGGAAPAIVRTFASVVSPTTGASSASFAMQRLDTQSIVVWSQEDRLNRTVVCH